ncbi:MAG: adenylate/guanylate cyclase domain-containing protein [Clostridia bacterium]
MLLILLTLSVIGLALFLPEFLDGLNFSNGIKFGFSTNGWIGFSFFILTFTLLLSLFVQLLQIFSLPYKLLVLNILSTGIFVFVFLIFMESPIQKTKPIAYFVKALLIEEKKNSQLWIILLSLVYIAFMLFVFWTSCRPISKVEKYINRLGDGRIKNQIVINGGKQFKNIEFGLNKINDVFREKENIISKTNLEYEKYIPKQFLKFFGKVSIMELELGNQVQKEVTTMYCDIRNSSAISTSLNLEDNFNYISSYMNIVSPLVKKHGGFVDKYFGDGMLAVFLNPQKCVECGNEIISSVAIKNKQNSKSPSVDVGIAINTGNVVFGVVGDENRKSPTIISNAVNFAGKMESFNKDFGSKLIFSKNTLIALTSKYFFAYRYIGAILTQSKGELVGIYESLECYNKTKKDILSKYKNQFEQAVRAFGNNKFEEAKNMFQAVYKKEKEDKVCYMYFNKCLEKMGKSKI